jgi:hypothetical protein
MVIINSPCIVDVSAQASAGDLNLAPALLIVSRRLSLLGVLQWQPPDDDVEAG